MFVLSPLAFCPPPLRILYVLNSYWRPCPGSLWLYLKVWRWAGWQYYSLQWRIVWWFPHRSNCGHRLESVPYLRKLYGVLQ